jgi:MSHA biogenesis protein MshL
VIWKFPYWGLVALILGGPPATEGSSRRFKVRSKLRFEIPGPIVGPRTISIPEDAPRPPVIRLLSQGRYTLNVQDADLPGLLLGLGKNTPVNIVVGPQVQGQVSADLQNVSLMEILEQVVRPRGFHYRIEGSTARIFRTDRETRIYEVDYPNTRRTGSAQFTVTGAVAQEIAMAGAEATASGDTSTSAVNTEHDVDFWKEIEEGIRLIVFGPGGSPLKKRATPPAYPPNAFWCRDRRVRSW